MVINLESYFHKIESINSLYNLVLSKKKEIEISSLLGVSRNLFIKKIISVEKQIVLLFPTIQSLNENKVELSILGLDSNLIVIDNLSLEAIQEKLIDLSQRKNFILLSTYDLLSIKLPSSKKLDETTTKIEVGGNLGFDDLIEYLNSINYNKESYVEQPGEFSVRGSIIDFWSFSEKQPCRIEFDGDFLESIRHFDPETQRSSNKINSVTLASSINEFESTDDIFVYLDNPLFIINKHELKDKFEFKNEFKEEIQEREQNLIDLDDELKAEIFENYFLSNKEFKPIQNVNELSFENIISKNARWIFENIFVDDNVSKLGFSEPPIINSNYSLLSEVLTDYFKKDFNIFITVENELQKNRLIELLTELNPQLEEIFLKGKIKIETLAIKNGFVHKSSKILLLTDYQIFNKPYRTKLSTKEKFKKSRVKDLASLKRGDYVVHENFGIGQYAGLEKIKIGEIEQESIKILYAEGGVVYVNLNYLSLVKKYSTQENVQPKLSVLGSNEWKTTKKKVKAKIVEAARELITLYAKRKASQGFSFSQDSIWQKELEASFMYEDTPDQLKITEEVKRDMENQNPMDRLVCGDVGFGKTEIAVRAAFKAVNDGKQVALLSPTTILTEQHFNTFRDRLSQFPVKIEALSRFQSTKKQKEILKNLAEGKIDIVIGTHRLLSKDIQFKDLGLLIIDEEQRFGVMAKEKLRSLKANVDTLTLTATPIPRTLNLSLLGARDLSIMATPPPNRQPIYTKVETFDIHKVREWILFEVQRKGQVYFVHDRVQSIEKIAQYVQKFVPEIKIGIAHGQMKPADLEDVIYKFLNKEFQVLVSTKIIESGLDIPNANTIIVNRADRFGLAELHQLRGRVGRSDRQAYAYFLVPSLNAISKKAIRRLQAIEEYSDLGEGFNLSMRDLEIRGAGNLLGTEQSGFIDSVGFDLYLKMVDEAVEELRQSEFSEIFKDLPKTIERSEPTLDTYFEIGIPQNYMPDQADRLSYYTSLFTLLKIEELDDIIDEMKDKFGKLPVIVERLIKVAQLRYYASLALFERIIIQKNKSILILPKADKENFYKNKFLLLLDFINKHFSKDVKFIQQNDILKLEINKNFENPEFALEFLINFFKQIIDTLN